MIFRKIGIRLWLTYLFMDHYLIFFHISVWTYWWIEHIIFCFSSIVTPCQVSYILHFLSIVTSIKNFITNKSNRLPLGFLLSGNFFFFLLWHFLRFHFILSLYIHIWIPIKLANVFFLHYEWLLLSTASAMAFFTTV